MPIERNVEIYSTAKNFEQWTICELILSRAGDWWIWFAFSEYQLIESIQMIWTLFSIRSSIGDSGSDKYDELYNLTTFAHKHTIRLANANTNLLRLFIYLLTNICVEIVYLLGLLAISAAVWLRTRHWHQNDANFFYFFFLVFGDFILLFLPENTLDCRNSDTYWNIKWLCNCCFTWFYMNHMINWWLNQQIFLLLLR